MSAVALADRVAATLGTGVLDVVRLDGGEVGEVSRVDLADGRSVVAKTGDTPLTVEARMLEHLAGAGLPTPGTLYASDALLVLSYVPGDDDLTPAAERAAADALATLHGHSAEAFGFPFDTLSGRYRQHNPWTDSWPAFYREHRLVTVARAARDEGKLPGAAFERVRALAADLDALLPEPEPALVHGDVWRGNLRVDGDRVTFLDPACYYGHAEVDLAYADWTGTFGGAFLERYRERRGVDDGYEERRPVYELYPLLEHVRYFGAADYLDPTRTRLAELGY